MRWTSVALIFVLAIAPAAAAEKTAAKEGGHSKEGGEPGTNIDMPFLMAPMTGADGKLSGYAYVSSRLTANSDVSANQARDKIAFIQDAFVRDVNAAPTGKAQDPLTLDTAALTARLVADARRIVGSTRVVTITFTQIRFSPLHPKKTTDDPTPPDNASAPKAQTVAAKTPVAGTKN